MAEPRDGNSWVTDTLCGREPPAQHETHLGLQGFSRTCSQKKPGWRTKQKVSSGEGTQGCDRARRRRQRLKQEPRQSRGKRGRCRRSSLRLHLSPRRRRLARKLLFLCTLSLSVTYLCYSLLGGSGTLQFPVVLQEPPALPPSPRRARRHPLYCRPPCASAPPRSRPRCRRTTRAAGSPRSPPSSPLPPGRRLGSGDRRRGCSGHLALTPVAPGEMITAQSALLEREAQESSTTHKELAGRRAVNGSSERGGALSTPNYGEKKLPQAVIIGVKKGGTRELLEAIGVHPGMRAVGVEPRFFDRNYEKGLEWYRCQCFRIHTAPSPTWVRVH